jgi:hypothetical protein
MREKAIEPKIDKSSFSVSTGFNETEDIHYWKKQSIAQRLKSIELLREFNYGYASATSRLHRVLEIIELKKG